MAADSNYPAGLIAGGSIGIDTRKRVNSPGSDSTVIVPPRRATISFDIESPNPVPLSEGLVVKNGLKILPTRSAGIPAPLSQTEILA